MSTHLPRATVTSVYCFAVGTIDPTTFLQIGGTIKNTAVEAQKPPQSTVSQIDHQRSFTSQTLALGAAVKLRMPGIQKMARTGTMYRIHRITMLLLMSQ